MAEEVPEPQEAVEEDPLYKQFVMDKDEREIEQKTVKVIGTMPKNVQDRFKMLYLLSDERSKLNDLFAKEIDALEAKIKEKKQPFLEERANVIRGEITDFTSYVPEFDATHEKLETIVAGIVKTDKEKEEEEEEAKTHVKTDVSHLQDQAGVPDFWRVCFNNNKMV